MKGNNELRLNEATVIEALQEYLDRCWNPSVKVTSIVTDGSRSCGLTFVVKIKEKPA